MKVQLEPITTDDSRSNSGREEEVLADRARRIFRAEMVRRGYSFQRLADALNAQAGGAPSESARTLINKVNRGRFSFAFLLRAGQAMGMTSITLAEDEPFRG